MASTPRDFILFSYGGGGPLHACALAHELYIPMVVIPPEPGNFSAIGMLLADARIDSSETFVGILNDETVATMAEIFAALEKAAAVALAAEFSSSENFFEHHGEMRFRGQRHNTQSSGFGSQRRAADPRCLRARLQAPLRARRCQSASGISSAASLCLGKTGATGDRTVTASAAGGSAGPEAARLYSSAGGWADAQIYYRDRLEPGFSGTGPVVIEEYGSTTLVWPGDKFEIGEMHEIKITVKQ